LKAALTKKSRVPPRAGIPPDMADFGGAFADDVYT
jgi:hypothetical protein